MSANKNILKLLLTQWKVLLIIPTIFATIAGTMALFGKREYQGNLKFVLEEGTSGGGLSSLIGMASQFGLDFNLKGSSAMFSGDNLIELMKSRMLIEKVLLEPAIDQNGKPTTIADRYLSFYPELKKGNSYIEFAKTKNRASFSRYQDSLLFQIYKDIVEKKYSIMKPDKKLSFINIEMKCRDEQLLIDFTNKLVETVSNYYVQMKTSLTSENIQRLEHKADSILQLLNGASYRSASSQEQIINLNPLLKKEAVPVELAQRDKFVLQTVYAEVVKNLELAKITLSQQTPLIQVVDKPIAPLKKLGKGVVKSGIGWFTFGLVFAIAVFVFINRKKILSK
jgi:uncharacterized protein involved in exopolysaccharide biosynthesis